MNKYWFKPKKYGYGATPVTWEGWAVVLLFVLYLVVLSFFIAEENVKEYLIYAGIGVAIVWYVSKVKTKEDWKWRWGRS